MNRDGSPAKARVKPAPGLIRGTGMPRIEEVEGRRI
jgi:hypothetical protein